MRRRRTAASTDTDLEIAVSTDETVTEPTTDTLPVSESTPAAEAPKPRRTRKKAEPVVEGAVAPTEPVAETPAPRSRRTRKPAAPVATEVVAEVVAAPESVEPEIVAPVELSTVEALEVNPESPSRRRRARRKAEAEAILTEVGIEPIIAESVSDVEPAEAEVIETAPAPTEPSSSRRSRRRRGGRGGERQPEAPEVAPPADDTESDDGRPKRVRGLRRTRTVAAPTMMVSGEDLKPTPTVDDEDTEAPADGAPKRVRGGRRGRVESAAVTLLPPPVVGASAAPVEPLPPVYQPLPADVLANLVDGKVAVRKGVAELLISGEPRLPFLFFVNTEIDEEFLTRAQRQIRLAYEAGVRIFTVLAHLPWKMRSGERRFEPLDTILKFVVENAPEALILPRLIFSPPNSWAKANPGEMARYQTGEGGDVSMGSRKFWEEEAVEALRAAVEHVATGPYASRVFGFYLEHGEWLYEKGVGYDLSEANLAAFRGWLRARYKHSLVALRSAWHDGSVTFESAAIPSWPAPAGPTLLLGAREGRWADFHEFLSDIVSQTINRLAKTVKEASGGRSAVAVSGGYSLELARTTSGHLALGKILSSPDVDILTAPVSYANRLPGGSAPLPVPVESVTLGGKLFILEDDTKTYLASGETPDSYNPKIESVEGVRSVHARNFGAAMAHGAGLSYMDLWGEGWLDDRETWEFIGGLREIAEQYATRRRNPRTKANADPDVAVIVDETSFFQVRHEGLLENLITAQRDTLVRSGARVGFYLQSDLVRKNFPTTPKLFLFLNAFKLDAAVKQAIRERWHDDGRTLAWVYGPGIAEENIAELSDVIGMQLRHQPWATKTGTRVFPDARSPLTDGLRGQKIGEETRLNPSLAVADGKAEILGEYPGGLASLAVRRHARWQSVFLGEPTLPMALLRGLYRLSGVPVYTADHDVAWIGDGLICLHSDPGGGTSVYLPEDAVLHDFVYGETLASGGRGARLSVPPKSTRLLFYGPKVEAQRFGAEPETAPAGLTVRDLPPAPIPFVFETKSRLGAAAINPEDEALFLAALDEIPESPVAVAAVAEGVVPESETETEASRKRRRRRRGRGRGGAELDETTEGDAGTSDNETVVSVVVEPGRRLSLEELLPDSDVPAGAELPPIPEEFLPLTELPVVEPEIEVAAVLEAVVEAPRPPRRPRRRRPTETGESPEPNPTEE